MDSNIAAYVLLLMITPPQVDYHAKELGTGFKSRGVPRLPHECAPFIAPSHTSLACLPNFGGRTCRQRHSYKLK